MLYLICVRRLLHHSSRFVSDLQQLQPGVAAPPPGMLQPQGDLPEGLMSAAARDAIRAYLASTLGEDMQSTSPDTPLNIDRVQVGGARAWRWCWNTYLREGGNARGPMEVVTSA